MTAYAIAHLSEVAPHTDIAEYIERITSTFAPYGGRFLVHAAQHEVKEGFWPGHIVIIGFPGLAHAQAWWDSPAYQQIVELRARHVRANIVIVEGVPEGYDPRGTAAAIRSAALTLASEGI